MNARKHPDGRRRSSRPGLYRPAGSSRAETAIFGTLGLVGLVAVVVAVHSASVPLKPTAKASAGDDPLPLFRYAQSGRLAADLRTVNAFLHYLFDLEPVRGTNLADCGAPKNAPMPTNTAPVEPKA